MKILKLKKKNFLKNRQGGFTLVEMLVAIAIFAIVLLIALGAILTIIDSNRKAQTLSSVMNNLNFAMDDMTRIISVSDPSRIIVQNDNQIEVFSLLADSGNPDNPGQVLYQFNESVNGTDNGNITKYVNDNGIEITGPEVDIDYLYFEKIGTGLSGDQPRILIVLKGTAKITEKTKSEFHLQTTVTPRQLNI